MENFIIRIYRYEKDNPRKLIGTVEDPGVDGKKAFSNVHELWNILNSGKKQTLLKTDSPRSKGK